MSPLHFQIRVAYERRCEREAARLRTARFEKLIARQPVPVQIVGYDNLNRCIEQRAFDAAVDIAARKLRTTDLDALAAAIRQAGIPLAH